LLDAIKKEIGKEKVTKVVDTDLHFEAILGELTFWTGRYSSIVDEDVNSRLLFKDLGCKLSHGIQGG
jgi:hypothetical protein